MSLRFNHVSKNALEVMFEKDLTRVLHQYHNEIVSKSLKDKYLYNELKNNYVLKSGKNNLDLINKILNYNTGGIFSTIRNYLGISYSLGSNQALQEFKINKKHNLSHFEKLDVLQDTEETMNNILNSYYIMMKDILIKNIILNAPFPSYINDIHAQFNKSKFSKRKTFFPDFPKIKDIVNNVKIAVTSKVMVKGMASMLNKFGGVTFMMYQTQEDEKVSSKCRKWQGKRLPTNMIEGIIPQHLNCRCRWIPDT